MATGAPRGSLSISTSDSSRPKSQDAAKPTSGMLSSYFFHVSVYVRSSNVL